MLSKLEFRLNDAGRLLVEAGVGRKLMDNPEEGRKDCHLPLCYLHLLQILCIYTHIHTPCWLTVFFITTEEEEEEEEV